MNKWELVTKHYDSEKPDHIRSDVFPYKVCDFNGIQNDSKGNKINRARQIVILQNFLVDNIDRMKKISNIIRNELSYGEYGSMAAELDSYIGELKDIKEDNNE